MVFFATKWASLPSKNPMTYPTAAAISFCDGSEKLSADDVIGMSIKDFVRPWNSSDSQFTISLFGPLT